MSADNGIYIGRFPKTDNLHNVKLRSVDYDYFVIHAQAIDNIYFFAEDQLALEVKFNGENPRTIVEYFGRAQAMDEAAAHAQAFKMEREISESDFPVLEYGINTLTFYCPLSYYKFHAHEIVYKWDKQETV